MITERPRAQGEKLVSGGLAADVAAGRGCRHIACHPDLCSTYPMLSWPLGLQASDDLSSFVRPTMELFSTETLKKVSLASRPLKEFRGIIFVSYLWVGKEVEDTVTRFRRPWQVCAQFKFLCD